MIAEGWMHGGMVDDLDREGRRKPIPSEEDSAFVLMMLDTSTTLCGFHDLVLKMGGATAEKEIKTALRENAAEICRRRAKGEDVMIPELDPFRALIFGSQASMRALKFLSGVHAGCVERHRIRKRGEKIIRPDFGDDDISQGFEQGLNLKLAPYRPKDSTAEVARKIELHGQEGAADVRYRARKHLPE
jgi:hypothetical protein